MIPAAAQLIINTVKSSKYVSPKLTLADVQLQVEQTFAVYNKSTVRHSEFKSNSAGEMIGACLCWLDADSFTGTELLNAILVFELKDECHCVPLAENLMQFLIDKSGPVDVHIPYGAFQVLSEIEKHDLGIHSVTLTGDVKRSIALLLQKIECPVFANFGLESRLIVESDVPNVTELFRNHFKPQFGWFLNSDAFLFKQEGYIFETIANAANTPHMNFGLFEGAELVGYFSSHLKSGTNFGVQAGLTVLLHTKWQNMGLGKSLYLTLLQASQLAGADVYHGGTAQPPVLKLGKYLEREPRTWICGRNPYFPKEHFVV